MDFWVTHLHSLHPGPRGLLGLLKGKVETKPKPKQTNTESSPGEMITSSGLASETSFQILLREWTDLSHHYIVYTAKDAQATQQGDL